MKAADQGGVGLESIYEVEFNALNLLTNRHQRIAEDIPQRVFFVPNPGGKCDTARP